MCVCPSGGDVLKERVIARKNGENTGSAVVKMIFIRKTKKTKKQSVY